MGTLFRLPRTATWVGFSSTLLHQGSPALLFTPSPDPPCWEPRPALLWAGPQGSPHRHPTTPRTRPACPPPQQPSHPAHAAGCSVCCLLALPTEDDFCRFDVTLYFQSGNARKWSCLHSEFRRLTQWGLPLNPPGWAPCGGGPLPLHLPSDGVQGGSGLSCQSPPGRGEPVLEELLWWQRVHSKPAVVRKYKHIK